MCLRGASVIQTRVFLKIPNPELRGYVVWMPVLAFGAKEQDAREQAWRIPDPRITRYFDAEGRLGQRYAPILRLAGDGAAWDVYLVFGPDARWDSAPPPPAYWMHQLGRRAPPERLLDANQIARAINELLGLGKDSRKAAEIQEPSKQFEHLALAYGERACPEPVRPSAANGPERSEGAQGKLSEGVVALPAL